MPTRYSVSLLIAAAVAFACGPRSHSSASASAQHRRAATGPVLESTFDIKVGKQVTFVFDVTNECGKHLELNFPSGQTHDFVVLDAAGREVWRWSEGRMFPQALQNKLLGSRESIRYEERWQPEDAHGVFSAVAVLASENHPIERKAEFTLP